MTQKEREQFYQEIYRITSQIPCGRVATYGQIAFLAGKPNRSRMAGKALSQAPEGLPCHRVVNSKGRLVPGWTEQRTLLEQEGVAFMDSGLVHLKQFRWNPF